MNFDVIVVGGGLGGSTLAAALALKGRRVLVLERETKFKDRVRGENLLPWGVDIAGRLGIVEDLVAGGAQRAPWWIVHVDGKTIEKRNCPETTPHGRGSLNMYHPQLQTVLIERAARAGVEVRRGAVVESVELERGKPSTVTFVDDSGRESATARLVVGADGRNSKTRLWGGFTLERDPDVLTIAGTLLDRTRVPDDASHFAIGGGAAMFIAPLGKQRARTYLIYPDATGRRRLTGNGALPRFFEGCLGTGVPTEWLAGVTVGGPLAEFEGADHWVASPTRPGFALIGDAAAATDPSWGCGLSLTLLDVETLASCLAESDDDVALERYAERHDVYYAALHRVLGWMTDLVWSPGPAADERRARVLAEMDEDPTLFPDPVGQGPFGPSDERARRLILGLDADEPSPREPRTRRSRQSARPHG